LPINIANKLPFTDVRFIGEVRRHSGRQGDAEIPLVFCDLKGVLCVYEANVVVVGEIVDLNHFVCRLHTIAYLGQKEDAHFYFEKIQIIEKERFLIKVNQGTISKPLKKSVFIRRRCYNR